MSNRALLVGGLMLFYLYNNRTATLKAAAGGTVKGVPASVPSTVGSGWAQVATGAVAGLLQGFGAAPRNNTPTTIFPVSTDITDRSDVLQEVVPNLPINMDDYINGAGLGWA